MNIISSIIARHTNEFASVVPFDAEKNHIIKMDFTKANTSLTDDILNNTDKFCDYVTNILNEKYAYGIGGYNEHRTIYARSQHFDTTEEPRRLHLGIDIWGKSGTPIYAPIGGYIHSFAFNDNYGDYGATIILQHQLDGISFNTLYGHLSLKDLAGLQEGQYINRGAKFAHVGPPKENGHWPPHLHFQIVGDMKLHQGDYPGVCKFSERDVWLHNSPDPDLILNMMQFAESNILK